VPAPAAQPATKTVGFTFKDAPYELVLDFMSREFGLPVIREAEAPKAPVTFISGESYSLAQALDIVNRLLFMHGLQLRREDTFLLLTKLEDARTAGQKFVDRVPADVGGVEIVTVVVPLVNASAGPLAEQLKPIMGKYGAITALPQQNALVMVDTAAQCRKLRDLVQGLDAAPPSDQAVKIFPLKFAKAEAVTNSLRGLVAEKRTTVLVNAKGERQTVQDDATPGLNLQPDVRTNSILAVGPQSRLATVEELVKLLDVPESEAGTREMLTFSMGSAAPAEVARKLTELFGAMPKDKQPTVLAMDSAAKVAVVGSGSQLAEAAALMSELDPGATANGREDGAARPKIETRSAVVMLENITPAAAQSVLQRLLSPRQNAAVRSAPTPDGKGIVLSGPAADVQGVRDLLVSMDLPPQMAREVRLVKVTAADPAGAVKRATGLWALDSRSKTDPVTADFDAPSATATLVGTRAGIEAYSGLLKAAEASASVATESRTLEVKGVKPSEAAPRALRLLAPMLTPSDGSVYVPPTIEPVDELGKVVVRARPEQFGVIEQVMRAIDAAGPSERSLRVIRPASGSAKDLLDKAMAAYTLQRGATDKGSLDARIDEASNSILATGDAESLAKFGRVADELSKLAGPAREVRLIELKHAQAAEAAAFLSELVSASAPVTATGMPAPVIEAVPTANALLVAAQPGQLAVIEQLVKNLDNQRTAERPPLRILRLKTTDAASVAAVLNQSFGQRPVEERNRRPVDITPDAATNTLVVSAHPDVFPEIEKLVAEFNETSKVDATGREIRIFPLRVALAQELAQTIDQMYPEPPTPRDPRTGQPRPDLRPAREIVVKADRGTNSLIVDAPLARMAGFEQIVEQLDRQQVTGETEIRTYRLVRANPEAVASTLRSLASGSGLGMPAEAGAARVPFTVTTEATTRTVVVSGPSAAFERVEQVVNELDAAPDQPTTGIRMYPLKHARADRLQPLLDRLLAARVREQEQAQGRPVGDIKSLLDVAADAPTNTLIVTAPEGAQQVAEELIRSLDTPAAQAGRNVVRVVPLMFADAGQAAATLTGALATMDLPTGGRVTAAATSGSNALVLSGAAEDLNKVEELVKQLDVRPVNDNQATVGTFEVKHVNAAAIAQTVQRLLAEQQENDPRVLSLIMRANRGQLPRPPQVRVEADDRTNSLMVSGPASTIELAKTIIERLDRPAEQNDRTVATFTPAKVDARRLVTAVTPVLAQAVPAGRKAVEVTPEPTSGSVVVVGSPEQVAAAVKLLAEFDDRAVNAPSVDLVLVPLAHVDANAAAPVVEAMLRDRSRWPADLRAAEMAGVAMAAPTVRAEAGTNRLVISVPGPMAGVAREVIAALDVPASGAASVGVKVFPLTKGKADAVAKVLSESLKAGRTPGEPLATATPETGTNSVVVTGTPERLAKAGAVVAELEAAPQEGGVVVRTVFLQAAKAEQVAPMVQALLARESIVDKLPMWERGSFIRQQGEQPRDVKVMPERRLNAVVLAGPAAAVEIGEQIVRGLDVAPGGEVAQPVVRVIPLTAADAAQVAASVQAVFAQDQAGAGPAPVVRVDASSNALIVRGDAEQVKAIEDVVAKLESTALAGSREMRMIPLDRSRADAGAMAEAIKKLLEQRGGTKVEIVPVEKLLERGVEQPAPKRGGWVEPRAAEPAREVADAWDGPVMHPVMALWLSAAMAAVDEPVKAAVQAVVDEQVGEITVAVDPATNSLVIVGPPRLAARVAELAEQLQKQMPAEPRRLRIVPLPEAVDARVVATVLSGAVSQIGRSGPENPAGFTGPVWVSADPAGGALLVAANDTDFGPVGELIAALARPMEGTGLTVKVYPLVNTTAPRVQAAMRDLLSPEPRGAMARRIRGLDVTVAGPDGVQTKARIEPDLVRVTADPAGASLVVAAPAATLAVIDRFVAMLDQSPTTDRVAIRRLTVENAKADDAAGTMQQLFDATRQGVGASDSPRATFVADVRTGAVLVTGTTAQLGEAERLLGEIDRPMDQDGTEVAIITLQQAPAADVRRVVEAVLGDRDTARKDAVRMSTADDSNLVIARGTPEQLERVRAIAAELDRSDVTGQPARAIKLERADAAAVAKAITQFYDDRARLNVRPGQRQPARRVAVVGDARTSTLVVSASEEDFAEVQGLVETFDKPAAARDLQFKVVELKHVRAGEIRTLLENVVDTLNYPPGFWMRQEAKDMLVVEVNDRTNSVVIMGQGEAFGAVERVVAALDVDKGTATQQAVKAVRVKHADPRVVGNAVQQALATPDWPRWRGIDPDGVRAEVDARSRTVVLVGRQDKLEQAATYIAQLDEAASTPDQAIESVGLKFARADQVAESLRRFFADRERSGGAAAPVAIIGSAEGNVIVVSAPPAELETVKQLVTQMDTPDHGDGRQREIFTLRNADPAEVARTVQEQFPRSATAKDAAVIVTPQPTSRSLIVSAPEQVFEQVRALVDQLDQPPSAEMARITTVTLATARAEDVALSLTQALPKQVNVKVTPVRRTNSLLLTGSPEAIEIAMEQITKLDSEPAKAQTEFRRIQLKHADVTDAAYTLRQILGRRPASVNEPNATVSTSTRDGTLLISATPDQFKEIEQVVAAVDVANGSQRTTEFVPLKFADARETASALEVFYGRYALEAQTPAARSVTIIPNPAAKSLVISADAAEWPGIRALLEKLDNEQYDTSRRLEIVALKHADATSVASSLNDAFAAPLRAELDRQRAARERRGSGSGRNGDGQGPDLPPVLIEGQETVTVVAERVTNSLIVSAAREKLDRIKAVVAQLDVPEFARLPEARIIPLKAGPASQVAQTLRSMFVDAARPGGGANVGVRSVLILGDDKAGALIVRADESQFAQIKALAETLQSEGDRSRASVRVLRLANVPAGRILPTLRTTFNPVAQQAGETLAIEVDRTANALVVASSQRLFEQVEQVAKELDGDAAAKPGEKAEIVPGLGQTVTMLDLTNLSPEQMRALLDQVGVTRAQPQDRPGIVSEPVTVVPMTSRRAVAIVANPKDAEAVGALVKAMDAEPSFAEQEIAFVRLRTARAQAVVQAVEQLLRPTGGAGAGAAGGPTPAAAALAEQIRRLTVHRDGIEQADVGIDLSKPVRVLAEGQTNSVVIASTKENVRALREVVAMLDALPVGDNVVVRFFPLNNAAAARVSAVVRDLFTQGDRLRTPVGTTIPAMPTSEVGKALAGQVAVSVDERTNTLVAAGREEAVALVEVLVKELDSGRNAGWIEPRVIALKHADATRLSRTLTQMFQGTQATTPEGEALRRQIGRLRVPAGGADAGKVDADAFAPLSTFVVVPDTQLNALLVVGSPANIQAVTELTRMLDIPAAAAENTVRLFTLKYAAADRVATVLREVFRQQAQTGTIRAEDDLILSTDLRSNTLVVSTSERSFGVVQKLIERLDAQPMDPTVGLHVVTVDEGDVTQLAPKIERLMRERIDSATRAGSVRAPSDSFSVQADPATRSLIVVASDENLAIVKDLVQVLVKGAQAVSGGQVTEVVQVSTGRADDLLPTVREMYVDRENAKRGPDTVRVTPNARLNSLIVRGTPEDVTAVRELVARLESTPVNAVTEMRRIELKQADAGEVVALLQNVLAGRPLGGTGRVGARQAQLLRFIHETTADRIGGDAGKAPTEAEISGAIQEQVTITAETRTNSVFVVAPARLMVLVEQMIADLDTTSAGARSIEIFKLKNADARQMADLLRGLFNLSQEGNRLVLVPGRGRPGDGTEQPAPIDGVDGPLGPSSLFPTSDERQALAITIDPRTNYLIVSATEEYLEQVRKVVETLDKVEANEREQLVYDLRNAKAAEVATTLREYFNSEADTIRQTLGSERAGSLIRLLEREVTVQGDPKSNRLLVGVSPRYKEAMDRIVSELDSTPPQVMIQVLLAEVTLDSSETWGMDVSIAPFGDRNYRMASLAGGAGVATALGVPNLTVASDDFALLIRALEVQGRLEVLSRPQVLARNNEPARIQVGEDVAIVEAVERLDNGNTRSDVTRKEVGIILNVTPSISADGFVNMQVQPEISAVSARTTEISEDFSAPIIDTRKVNTNISVRDGETVVIGGLIQTREEERRSKVPVLGDIPGVGEIFKSKEYNRSKTELLVIITPRIIETGTEGAREAVRKITREELRRLSETTQIEAFTGPIDQVDEPGVHGPAQPRTPVRRRPQGEQFPPPPAPAAAGPSSGASGSGGAKPSGETVPEVPK
jgi:type II secretion system protein D